MNQKWTLCPNWDLVSPSLHSMRVIVELWLRIILIIRSFAGYFHDRLINALLTMYYWNMSAYQFSKPKLIIKTVHFTSWNQPILNNSAPHRIEMMISKQLKKNSFCSSQLIYSSTNHCSSRQDRDRRTMLLHTQPVILKPTHTVQGSTAAQAELVKKKFCLLPRCSPPCWLSVWEMFHSVLCH